MKTYERAPVQMFVPYQMTAAGAAVRWERRVQRRHFWRTRMGFIAYMLYAVLSACTPGDGSKGSEPDQLPTSKPTEQPELIRYANDLGSYRAIVHLPRSFSPTTQVPLYVMVHGCNTTAEQQQSANLIDSLADREGFAAIYPDFDLEQPGAAALHPFSCWRFEDPIEQHRGNGDNDAIAALTRITITKWNIDPDRVYLVGMSSGAFMISDVGASYPDLYAAIAIVAGGPYGSSITALFNPVAPMLAQTEMQARQAYEAMGAYRRQIPFIEIHGSVDTTVYPQNGDNAVRQWLMTNNLVAGNVPSSPYPLNPTFIAQQQKAGGYAYEIREYRSSNGCLIGSHIIIEGMNHFWPGGSDDPSLADFTDPKAPSGAELTWSFFKDYRLSRIC